MAIYSGFYHSKQWFSIAMLVITRGYLYGHGLPASQAAADILGVVDAGGSFGECLRAVFKRIPSLTVHFFLFFFGTPMIYSDWFCPNWFLSTVSTLELKRFETWISTQCHASDGGWRCCTLRHEPPLWRLCRNLWRLGKNNHKTHQCFPHHAIQ